MDAETHDRFLEYLELFGYFGRADMKKLTAEQFSELDAELQKLSRQAALDAAEQKRMIALRRVLLRD